MNFSKSQYFLVFLLLLIIILSLPLGDNGQQLMSNPIALYFFGILGNKSEINLLEISQAGILCYAIYETIKVRKLFLKKFNLLSFFLRLGLLLFLFYEEISFLTKGKFEFATYTSNNQLNIHNAFVWKKLILENFQIPIINYQFSLSYYVFILILGTLFIGFGGYLKILKKIKPLFLEKQYSFFFLIYTANIFLRSILLRLNLTESDSFLNGELLELHMYSVLLIDTLFKNNRLTKSKSKFE